MDNAALLEAVEQEFGPQAREGMERTGVVVDPGPILSLSTPALLRLLKASAERQFNRQLPPQLAKRIDFTGTHVVRRMLFHWHAQGQLTTRHERCQVWLKFRGRRAAYETMLDFDEALLNKLGKIVNPSLNGVRVGDVWITEEGVESL
jgi:hypothetical protein